MARTIDGLPLDPIVRPHLVKPGQVIQFKVPDGLDMKKFSSITMVFHSEEDMEKWRDAMDEAIFDLNHPAVSRPDAG